MATPVPDPGGLDFALLAAAWLSSPTTAALMLAAMLAEKCPNCGAYLPVRRPGVTVRTCEFCDLEVPGDAPVVEVPRLTVTRPVMRAPSPSPVPKSSAAPVAMVIVIAAVIAVVALLLVVKSATRHAPHASPPPTPVAEQPAPPGPPPEPPQVVALREAIAQAGGETSVDIAALGSFAESRIRALADDAILIMFNCKYVRSDGRADLTLQGDGSCGWEYRSPSRVRRPDGTPAGISVSVPCVLAYSAGASMMHGDVIEHSYGLSECRQWFAVKPPRCTVAEIWQRALAAGAPADAVAHLHFAARYRSGYDPVDPADQPDRPERGVWTLDIERDDSRDFRYEGPDDCGQPPPTDAERAILASVDKLRPAFKKCVDHAAGKQPSIEAFEMIWRLTPEKVLFSDPGIDVEGVFQGDLDGLRSAWADCADGLAHRIKIPDAAGEVRLVLRVERDGTLELQPPPFD
jgi:hypothetical protein